MRNVRSWIHWRGMLADVVGMGIDAPSSESTVRRQKLEPIRSQVFKSHFWYRDWDATYFRMPVEEESQRCITRQE